MYSIHVAREYVVVLVALKRIYVILFRLWEASFAKLKLI